MHAGTLVRTHAAARDIGPNVTAVNTTAGSFGEYLERQMAQAGFSNREQLGKATGIEATTIGRWIRGDRPPTIEKLRDVAPHLKVRLGDLMVAAGLATREELGMVGAPPAPAPAMPAVLRSILSRLASPRYKDRHKAVLLEFVQDDVDRWDRVMDAMEVERAEAQRGRR
jgi:transcriptional regulator with XRE-family HTH domain